MSGREKVFDDPLSMFNGSSAQSSSVTKSGVETTTASKQSDTLKSINTDKVHIKETKKGAGATKEAVPEVKVNREVAALVGGTTIVQKEIINKPSEDILSDLSGLEPSSRKGALEPETFQTNNTVFKASATKASANPSVVSQAQRQTYSKFHQQGVDDDTLHDLSVTRMIEREELDYDTYGVSNVRQGGYTVNKPPTTNLTKEFNELDSLEALLSSGTDTVSKTKSSTAPRPTAAPAVPVPAAAVATPAAVDLSTLNLNDYINSQQTEAEEGGGLFD